jgi:hypothetical protein
MELICKGRRPARGDDTYVRFYRKFLKDYQAALQHTETANLEARPGRSPQVLELIERLPHLGHAQRLYFLGESEERAVLEARILARESDETIAAKTSLSPLTVDCYEKLFFNVRDRLDCTDWVCKAAVRRPSARRTERGPLDRSDIRAAYRMFGYCGGGLVLDVLLSCVPGGRPCHSSPAGADFCDLSFECATKVRAALAAYCLEVNHSNVMHLIHLGFRMALETSDDADTETEDKNVFEPAFLEAMSDLSAAASERKTPTPAVEDVDPKEALLAILADMHAEKKTRDVCHPWDRK